ncbi:MAG: ImmA/IrrE family metallo-endopeptidase [Lactobacillus crispatus]|nr:ImmA/IrrE family metallo-endopeptidase [Lactobacillus crispatus]MCT7699078.1 ImmA/IrrE family metallo-endopeptidase [Lactobacillus crispatus]
MSTRSNVSILRPDGSVTTQFYYMDGGLSFTGQRLIDTYHTLDDADSLIELGNYNDSHISESPAAAHRLMDNYDAQKKAIDEPARNNYKDLREMVSDISKSSHDGKYLQSDVEYHYLFAPNAEGTYQWHTINRDGIKPLTQKVIDNEKENGTLDNVNWNKSSITEDWSAPLTNEEVKGLKEGILQQLDQLKQFQKLRPELVQDQEKLNEVQEKINSEKANHSSKENSKTKGKFDKTAWKKQHEQTVEKLKKGLLKEVENYTQSPEKVVEMLDFMSKFHNYSERNALLIHMQRPGATAVGSYAKFKKLGYSVNKGEKGIKIFVPSKATVFYRQGKDGKKNLTSLKNATKEEKQQIKEGNIDSYQKTFYKIGTVFDAPQTNMPKEKYPELYPNRHQDFAMENPEQLDLLEKGLRSVADDMKMPVVTYNPFDAEIRDKYKDPQNAKGYFNRATNEIVLNGNNTPTENVSVLAHELGHAQLHNSQKQEKDLPRELKEMQAELTSYLYCSHFGIDTKQETIDYIASWTSNGQKFNELPNGVKGQILTHVDSATRMLVTNTDKVIEKEQDKIDQIAKENFLDTPKHSQWYLQKEKMEQEVSNNENDGINFKSELTALRKIEDSMSRDEIRKLDNAFTRTQSWQLDNTYSRVSNELKDEIKENQKKAKPVVSEEKKINHATVKKNVIDEKVREAIRQRRGQELDR